MKASRSVGAALLGGAGLLSAGCASNHPQPQWTDPEFAGHSLRGEKVLIVCTASETEVKRICQDRMTARLAASGVVVTSPDAPEFAADTAETNDSVAVAAHSLGVKAVWRSTVAPAATVTNPGPTDTAYAANLVLTDIATGRVIWTIKLTAPASRDVAGQIDKLAQTGVEAAKKAGML